jgi:WD40 repeat protein
MSEVKLPRSPYKGLMPFSEEDAPFFFGREGERKIISANLRTQRLTLLYGPSGVGKSSVIKAGVVYHLRKLAAEQRKMSEEVATAGSQAGGVVQTAGEIPASACAEWEGYGNHLVVIVFSKSSDWIGNPLESLQAAIFAGLKESAPRILNPEMEDRLRALKLTEMLKEATNLIEDLELLIILDQFEEYFVYHPVDEGEGKFADEFSRAVVNLDLRTNFLISIREDWLSRLDRFRGRIPNLFENSISIDHLERTAAHQAITKPIKRYNELIDAQGSVRPKVEITEDFILAVLNQLELLDQPDELGQEITPPESPVGSAGRRIQTARLQIVLQHLWAKVKDDPKPTLDASLLRQPDTAKTIFQLHLQEALEHLSAEEQRVAADFFGYLITDSGTKFASTAGGLAARCDRQPEEVRAVLEKLSEHDVRILNRVAPSPGQRNNEPRYEITSDVLAAPVLDWVKDIRAEQQRKKEVQAQQLRRWAVFRAFMIVFTLILVAAIIILTFTLMKVRRQRREIEAAQRVAEAERISVMNALKIVYGQDELIPHSKAVLRGHSTAIISAFFTSPKNVLTASTDGSAILWDIDTKEKVREFKKPDDPLISASSGNQTNPLMMGSLESSSKEKLAVMGSLDGRVILWNTESAEIRVLREKAGDHITDVRFSPDGESVVAATTVGTVMVWRSATGENVKLIGGNNVAIRQLAFSPRGRFLAAASEDDTVRVWRVSDWSERVLKGHTGVINGLAFSPDEELIATASADKTVRVWKHTTDDCRVFNEHTASVNSVSFDPAGKRVLSASDDQTARIWNLDNLKVVELSGHKDKVLSAAFDPSGTQVVTGSKDTTARIWVASTGWSLTELRGHLKQVTYVAFAPDGKLVLTASDDATARVWYVPRPGDFNLKPPTIDAIPKRHVGPCPVTIRFFVTLTAASGSGNVIYRFRGSDGRIWPIRTQTFNEPGSSYVNWYWRITRNYSGSETIEVIEPTGIKPEKATFSVKCTKNANTVVEEPPEVVEENP